MLAEIVTRLKDTAMPPLNLVASASEFAALKGAPPKEKQPAAYVMPIAETAGPNRLANGVRQQVAARVGVVLALGNLSDRRGGPAAEALEAVRDAVKAALVGWPPSADDEPLTFAQGRAVTFADGVFWWQDEFATGSTLSSV